MSEKTSAVRYVQAIFELALETNEIDRWSDDLNTLAELGGEEELLSMLENPRVPSEEKQKVVVGALGGMNEMTLNLASLLIARGNFRTAPEISVQYQHMVDAYRGIERAEVTTATALDDNGKKAIEDNLGRISGKKVIISQTVDPQLLGGFVARMSGKLLDGSVRTRLLALKREIADAGV